MTYDVTSPHSIILSTVDQEATMRRRGSTETLESVRLGHAMLESYPRALSKLLNRFYNPIGPAQVLYTIMLIFLNFGLVTHIIGEGTALIIRGNISECLNRGMCCGTR